MIQNNIIIFDLPRSVFQNKLVCAV